ncbi:Acetylcholine receptor subunit beta-type unc-29 [Dirofilaria immitis]|nr:Acetylcholine receptor subunit beta-type unc-29 [Dirofilaria immitis]
MLAVCYQISMYAVLSFAVIGSHQASSQQLLLCDVICLEYFSNMLVAVHVEAPTSSSIILAGVMLKLGGARVYRITTETLYSCAHQIEVIRDVQIWLITFYNVSFACMKTIVIIIIDVIIIIFNRRMEFLFFPNIGYAICNENSVMIMLEDTCYCSNADLIVKPHNGPQPKSDNRLVLCSDEEERLMVDVFRGYNSLIQPVRNLNETPIIVKIALQLVLLINVDEKDQVMHTNVWLTLKWHDFQMRWNPVDYGEIQNIRVAPDKVWLPDIVLFNNADGNYEVSFMCNVVINYKGEMLWVPPAIYKSSCIIDYNENEIKLEFEQAEWVDLSEYAPSSIWDVMDAPAALVNKRSRIEFQVRIRRKTLFYTVVLIIPTVLMAFLSMAVFFLPTDSGEKMTLTISVLLSIVVFLLLVSKILPPTSSTIPLMAKYLLLTFVLNVITILVTVIIINVYFRGPTTHRMPKWVRTVFLQVMPKLLCMQRPKPLLRNITQKMAIQLLPHFLISLNSNSIHLYIIHCAHQQPPAIELTHVDSMEQLEKDPSTSAYYPLSPDALRAIDAIEYITNHLKQEEEYKMVTFTYSSLKYRDDWKYVAMIIDRLLLYVFFGITVGGTCGILFSAPYVFQGVDQRAELQRLIHLYKNGGEI